MVQNENKDILSNLPDDILVSILLRIDMNDATRSSILSRRWRYLSPYSYFTTLDFDASKAFPVECKGRHHISFKNVKPRFMNWVNQVVISHRAQFINDFRICFPLSQAYSDCICIWIELAISKRVKNLELDFSGNGFIECHESHLPQYSLPSNVFKGSPYYENDISYLTSLRLTCVDVSGELLELLLARCHLLERLYVEHSMNLLDLKIVNLSGMLRYLSIHKCLNLKELEIHAANLVSFEFTSYHQSVNVVYTRVPSLVEAKFRWRYFSGLSPYMSQIECFSAQLTKLSLDVDMIREYLFVPSFLNVKYLELRATLSFPTNLLPLRYFAEACPLLHHFNLQVLWMPRNGIEQFDSESESDSELEEEEYSLEDVKHWLEEQEEGFIATLPYLRKLEWTEAFSLPGQFEYELALYLVKNAVLLEKFICSPRTPHAPKNLAPTEEEAPRQRARRLAMVIPPHVHFVIM
ncbi:hypothetical protein OROMI_029239 [Orobanche minor]